MGMNLDITIDEDLKVQASKCESSVGCLNGNGHKLCNVVCSCGDQVLFIEFQKKRRCNYKSSFGFSSYLCNCPVRKEIYKKYGV